MNETVCLKVRTASGVSELNVIELIEVDGRTYLPSGDFLERMAFLEGRLHSLETQFAAALAHGG